jgi:hypothetical protein
MANHEKERTRFQQFKDRVCGEKCRVPRIGEIQGDDIIPGEPHGFLIVYEKGKYNVGKIFYEIFNELTDVLSESPSLHTCPEFFKDQKESNLAVLPSSARLAAHR